MFDRSEVQTLIQKVFPPEFERTFERNTMFARYLAGSGRVKQTQAAMIIHKVQISGTPGAGSYREDGSIGINRRDLGPRYATVRHDWSQNKVPIAVTGLAEAVSQTPASQIKAAAEATRDALAELQRNLNLQQLADGQGNLNGVDTRLNPGVDLTGIQAAFDDGSQVAVYGGVDRSIAPWWQSFVLTNPGGGLRPITEQLLHQAMNEVVGVREKQVTDLICSLGVETMYGQTLGQDRRYSFSGSETPSYRGGFGTASFGDIEVVGMPLYQENRLDGFDRNLLEYHVLLNLQIDPRDAGDADAMKFFAKIYSQMIYKNPFGSFSIRHLESLT